MELPTITANANIVEQSDTTVAPPAIARSLELIGVAEELRRGVKVLAASNELLAWPTAMLCAHALECLLKASIASLQQTPEVPHIHDLAALWRTAGDAGLRVSPIIPSWAIRLNELHFKNPDGKKFLIRYAEGVHGIVTPAPADMVAGLDDVFAAVGAIVYG